MAGLENYCSVFLFKLKNKKKQKPPDVYILILNYNFFSSFNSL